MTASEALQGVTVDRIRGERARRSLSQFVRQAWSIVDPDQYIHGWHLDAISEHLEAVSRGEIRNLIINMPPRHSKSLEVSVFWPAWEWIDHPELRLLYTSYAESLSIRDGLKTRRLIQSKWYQDNWGDRFRITSDQNTKQRYENDRAGYRIASSVGGSNTGEGGDRIVVDDPHNVDEAPSDTIRQGVIDWFDQAMSTRLSNPKTGARVIVAQRCHERDLCGHLLDRGGWELLCLSAEYEGAKHVTSLGWTDPRTEHGELLCPQRFGRPEIETLKIALGSYGTAGQLQQRPSPSGGGIVKEHWWRYWAPDGMRLPPVAVKMPDGSTAMIEAVYLPRLDSTMQSWDMSFKDLKTSDWVVGQVWGQHRANRFLLDQVRKRMDLPATLQAVRDMSRRWEGARRKLVEDKANGSAVIQSLRSSIAGLIPVNPEGGKESRAAAVSPIIESGNVYLPHPSIAPWVTEFIREWSRFPNGAYDDQVDCCTQALNNSAKPGGGWRSEVIC